MTLATMQRDTLCIHVGYTLRPPVDGPGAALQQTSPKITTKKQIIKIVIFKSKRNGNNT